MHTIKIIYPSTKTQEYKESITYAASIDLFLRKIHTVQLSASTLQLESSRDLTLALLILSYSVAYPIRVMD